MKPAESIEFEVTYFASGNSPEKGRISLNLFGIPQESLEGEI